ncbi:hypothetical protein, partial [Leisingera sp. MMG026]|uniref:hypothetical protein n=1 Tax=Leisingera sp. MMG026 TaxID=2909982 RepID=UPI001F2E6847
MAADNPFGTGGAGNFSAEPIGARVQETERELRTKAANTAPKFGEGDGTDNGERQSLLHRGTMDYPGMDKAQGDDWDVLPQKAGSQPGRAAQKPAETDDLEDPSLALPDQGRPPAAPSAIGGEDTTAAPDLQQAALPASIAEPSGNAGAFQSSDAGPQALFSPAPPAGSLTGKPGTPQ